MVLWCALQGHQYPCVSLFFPQHSYVQHQPGEQADHGLQRLGHPGWGRQQPRPPRGVHRTQTGGGQRARHGPVQLLLLPLHALPGLTLHYDDPHQLVQVSPPPPNTTDISIKMDLTDVWQMLDLLQKIEYLIRHWCCTLMQTALLFCAKHLFKVLHANFRAALLTNAHHNMTPATALTELAVFTRVYPPWGSGELTSGARELTSGARELTSGARSRALTWTKSMSRETSFSAQADIAIYKL